MDVDVDADELEEAIRAVLMEVVVPEFRGIRDDMRAWREGNRRRLEATTRETKGPPGGVCNGAGDSSSAGKGLSAPRVKCVEALEVEVEGYRELAERIRENADIRERVARLEAEEDIREDLELSLDEVRQDVATLKSQVAALSVRIRG